MRHPLADIYASQLDQIDDALGLKTETPSAVSQRSPLSDKQPIGNLGINEPDQWVDFSYVYRRAKTLYQKDALSRMTDILREGKVRCVAGELIEEFYDDCFEFTIARNDLRVKSPLYKEREELAYSIFYKLIEGNTDSYVTYGDVYGYVFLGKEKIIRNGSRIPFKVGNTEEVVIN